MKIESSNIGLAGQHEGSRRVSIAESLHAWTDTQRPAFENPPASNLALNSAIASISAAARQAAAISSPPASPANNSASDTRASSKVNEVDDRAKHDPKLRLLIDLVESMTGQKIRIVDIADLQHAESASIYSSRQVAETAQTAGNQPQGWGIEYERHETIHEMELTRFSAQGVIKTSEGAEIQFSISIEMRREFFRQRDVSIRAGDAVKKDPLVVNFNGSAAQLTGTKFSFDLNSDGQTEQIPFLTPGSGFLALDKNDNGTVDNGTELFGTQSGDGFADLKGFDEDNNNWIDENDAVYSRLKFWSKDSDGNDILDTLMQRNVGALYLGNVATPFDLKDTNNALQGQIRSSGVYLKEDGGAGTLQQIDLVA